MENHSMEKTKILWQSMAVAAFSKIHSFVFNRWKKLNISLCQHLHLASQWCKTTSCTKASLCFTTSTPSPCSFLWSQAHGMEGSGWGGVEAMIHFHGAFFHVSTEWRLIEPQGSGWSCFHGGVFEESGLHFTRLVGPRTPRKTDNNTIEACFEPLGLYDQNISFIVLNQHRISQINT